MTRGLAKIGICSYAIIFLAGCTSPAYRTVVLDKDDANTKGYTYYLPMRHAKVTFQRARADSKAAEAVTKAKGTAEEKQGALKVLESTVKAGKEYLVELKKNGFDETTNIYKEGQAALIKTEQEKVAAQKAVATAQAAAATALANEAAFNASQPMCGWVDSFKVELQDFVADASERYELIYLHSSSREDHFKIGSTASGLLKSADAELKDQSGEILISLAKSIAAFPSIGPPSTARSGAPPAGKSCSDLNWQAFTLVAVVDPTEQTEWNDLAKRINAASVVKDTSGADAVTFSYGFDSTAQGGTPSRTPEKIPVGRISNSITAAQKKSCTANPSALCRDAEDGIYYRRERPHLVTVKDGTAPIGAFVLVVPNGAPVDLLTVEATAFVTNDYKIGFENGMLVSLDTTRPSEVLEVVSIPWKIARETLSLVTDIIKIRVDYSTNQASLVEQEVKLIGQMEALIEAQRKLDEAKKSGGSTTESEDSEESEDGEEEPK